MSCAEPVRLPSSAVIAIPKGPIVLVAAPAVDWVAAAMAFITDQDHRQRAPRPVGRIKSPPSETLPLARLHLTGHPWSTSPPDAG